MAGLVPAMTVERDALPKQQRASVGLPPRTDTPSPCPLPRCAGARVLEGMRQMACKPGSVFRCRKDDHSSGMRVATHLSRPTRTAIRKRITCRPYLVLLPVGLALPPLLPGTRCALTAPFQPCCRLRGLAVSFLWRCPWGRPRRPLAGTVSPWSPDFPLPPSPRLRRTGRLNLAKEKRSSGHLTRGRYSASRAQRTGAQF